MIWIITADDHQYSVQKLLPPLKVPAKRTDFSYFLQANFFDALQFNEPFSLFNLVRDQKKMEVSFAYCCIFHSFRQYG